MGLRQQAQQIGSQVGGVEVAAPLEDVAQQWAVFAGIDQRLHLLIQLHGREIGRV